VRTIASSICPGNCSPPRGKTSCFRRIQNI
jgi:hypothetical protein